MQLGIQPSQNSASSQQIIECIWVNLCSSQHQQSLANRDVVRNAVNTITMLLSGSLKAGAYVQFKICRYSTNNSVSVLKIFEYAVQRWNVCTKGHVKARENCSFKPEMFTSSKVMEYCLRVRQLKALYVPQWQPGCLDTAQTFPDHQIWIGENGVLDQFKNKQSAKLCFIQSHITNRLGLDLN